MQVRQTLKQLGVRKRKVHYWSPNSSIRLKILESLANAGLDDKTMNKYQLEKETGLPRQTVHNAMIYLRTQGLLPKSGWVQVAKTTKTRVGLLSAEYELTQAGMKHVALLTNNANLRTRLCQKLNVNFQDLLTEKTRRSEAFVDSRLSQIRPILVSYRAPPGFKYILTVKADKEGKVEWSESMLHRRPNPMSDRRKLTSHVSH